MIWLALAIFLSTAFAQVMKWAVARGCSTPQVAAINYVIASGSAALVGYLINGLHYDRTLLSIGILGGVSYAVAVVAIFNVIRLAGVAVTGTLMRISTMVAVVGAIFLFREMPNVAQWIGIGLTVATFLVLKPAKGKYIETKKGWALPVNVMLVILGNGTGFLAWKMTQAYGCGGQLHEFQSLLFGIPMLTCAVESGARRDGITRPAVVIGIILGLVNFCSVRCSLQGIQSIPAVVFFPIYSCGGLILNAVVAAVLWRERMSKRTIAGIAIAAVALLLMNLR
ncbi:MAG: hypothetical protein GXP25_11245 [Planctomycetes bacterium]|nr:hypothetical protein [Planctomycetota bacterium]